MLPLDRSCWRGLGLALAFGSLVAALAALASTGAVAAEPGRAALCILEQNGVTVFAGRCRLQSSSEGGFTVTAVRAQPLLPGITAVSVSPLRPALAEVRGLTLQGVNSRWGRAVRSSEDPACWVGVDFAVCMY
jgi:hypothetical protein